MKSADARWHVYLWFFVISMSGQGFGLVLAVRWGAPTLGVLFAAFFAHFAAYDLGRAQGRLDAATKGGG